MCLKFGKKGKPPVSMIRKFAEELGSKEVPTKDEPKEAEPKKAEPVVEETKEEKTGVRFEDAEEPEKVEKVRWTAEKKAEMKAEKKAKAAEKKALKSKSTDAPMTATTDV